LQWYTGKRPKPRPVPFDPSTSSGNEKRYREHQP
jgi:hypothetical protein